MSILKECNVLLVEDEPITLKHTSKLLEFFFHKVISAKEMDEALRIYGNASIDAIFTDINLSYSNGLSFIKTVRNSNEDIPVVVFTSHVEKQYLLESIKLNVTDYLEKPLNYDALKETLGRCEKTISKIKSNNGVTLCDNILFDSSNMFLTINGNHIALSKKESDFICLLWEKKNQIVPYEHIIFQLWGDGMPPNSTAFHSFVHRIRKKLGSKEIIKTFSSAGCMLIQNVE